MLEYPLIILPSFDYVIVLWKVEKKKKDCVIRKSGNIRSPGALEPEKNHSWFQHWCKQYLLLFCPPRVQMNSLDWSGCGEEIHGTAVFLRSEKPLVVLMFGNSTGPLYLRAFVRKAQLLKERVKLRLLHPLSHSTAVLADRIRHQTAGVLYL